MVFNKSDKEICCCDFEGLDNYLNAKIKFFLGSKIPTIL